MKRFGWNASMLHVPAVHEPSLKSLEEWDWAPFVGFRRVQFQKQNDKQKRTVLRCTHRGASGYRNSSGNRG